MGLVAYARDRGIRLIAEADMTGHSQGRQGLSEQELEFYSTNSTGAFGELRNDAAGVTVGILEELLPRAGDLQLSWTFCLALRLLPHSVCPLKCTDRHFQNESLDPLCTKSSRE